MKKIELLTKKELEMQFCEYLIRREMPDEFLYLGDTGSKNWLALDESAEFTVAKSLTDLLQQSIDTIASHISSKFDVVSIGVGSGQKERIILETLIRRGLSPGYYPVDVGSELVDAALSTVTDMDIEKVGIVGNLKQLALLRPYWKPPVLLCLLGNNFCNYEPATLLPSIYDQLEADDLFLFDCHLFPADREQQKLAQESFDRAYHNPPNVAFNISPLTQRGLNPENCSFQLNLINIGSKGEDIFRTIKLIRILGDTTIQCEPGSIKLAAGEIIRMGFTYLHTEKQLREHLKQNGFTEVEIFLNNKADNILLLAKKH